eukprot:scaffold2923_cov313-Pinguiococcus_pyrenoidosus.AAC.10
MEGLHPVGAEMRRRVRQRQSTDDAVDGDRGHQRELYALARPRRSLHPAYEDAMHATPVAFDGGCVVFQAIRLILLPPRRYLRNAVRRDGGNSELAEHRLKKWLHGTRWRRRGRARNLESTVLGDGLVLWHHFRLGIPVCRIKLIGLAAVLRRRAHGEHLDGDVPSIHANRCPAPVRRLGQLPIGHHISDDAGDPVRRRGVERLRSHAERAVVGSLLHAHALLHDVELRAAVVLLAAEKIHSRAAQLPLAKAAHGPHELLKIMTATSSKSLRIFLRTQCLPLSLLPPPTLSQLQLHHSQALQLPPVAQQPQEPRVAWRLVQLAHRCPERAHRASKALSPGPESVCSYKATLNFERETDGHRTDGQGLQRTVSETSRTLIGHNTVACFRCSLALDGHLSGGSTLPLSGLPVSLLRPESQQIGGRGATQRPGRDEVMRFRAADQPGTSERFPSSTGIQLFLKSS